MRWAYGVTCVPERFETTLRKTLKSLQKAGFPDPVLYIDGYTASTIPFRLRAECNRERQGVAKNWLISFVRLYLSDPIADVYIMFQDDIVLCTNTRSYLEQLGFPENGYCNLITMAENDRLTANEPRGWVSASTIPGNKELQTGRGAVALVFPRPAALALLQSSHIWRRFENPTRGPLFIDGGVVTALNQQGFREYVHNPSLVDHIGYESTVRSSRWGRIVSRFPGESWDALQWVKTSCNT